MRALAWATLAAALFGAGGVDAVLQLVVATAWVVAIWASFAAYLDATAPHPSPRKDHQR